MKWLRPIIVVTVSTWLLVGLAYPLVMTGVSQVLFPYQANGSPVKLHGVVVASRHIGQYFNQGQYFWSRPSATKPPYNAEASGASNLGPTNQRLLTDITARMHYLLESDPGLRVQQIPASLVESSASGLDPDITFQSALIQIPRVVKATGLSQDSIAALVKENVLAPQFGVIGRRRINVVQLNLAIYKLLHRKT
jgi:K+-transporting ATPase ATPase C chain